eukprot:TRINITY_DN4078_c2_g1_i1.p1 TRINITY_DN4078_c2_g1~~TRINITY_DN4078_c2_g1_i1.p1  ORF type:complete len:1341 (-),score=306.63 TRINITY_DN4078_c2_g1_i1:33-4055(-)
MPKRLRDDDDEEVPKPKKAKLTKNNIKDRKKAEQYVNSMAVPLTGARPGETLMGITATSKDAIIKIVSATVPPSSASLDIVKQYDDLWKTFLNKLGAISFFSEMEDEEKEKWLAENKKNGQIDLSEVDDCSVEVLQMGNSTMLELEESNIEKILSSGEMLVKDISELYPKKPGSTGIRGRHTLIFLSSYWKVVVTHQQTSETTGLVVDMVTGSVKNGAKANEKQQILSFDHIPKSVESSSTSKQKKKKKSDDDENDDDDDSYCTLSFLVNQNGITLNEKNVYDILKKVELKYLTTPTQTTPPITTTTTTTTKSETNGGNDTESTKKEAEVLESMETKIQSIRKLLKNLTSASLKSLIQKIIRFRPLKIDLRDKITSSLTTKTSTKPTKEQQELYSSRLVLFVSIAELLINPGSFVPDIQRFVSGVESVFKRLVVISFEDSFITRKQFPSILKLAGGAFLSQRAKSWRPSEDLVRLCFTISSEMLQEKRCFQYSTAKSITPYELNDKPKSLLHFVSSLIDQVRSFAGDLTMIRDISQSYDTQEKNAPLKNIIEPVMPFCHFVDQHWAPEIVYFYDPQFLKTLKQKGSKPYSKLFEKLFTEVTGINPRRGKITANFEKDSFVASTRKAQDLLLFSRRFDTIVRTHDSSEQEVLEFTLDRSWLAGMVGAIEIKAKKCPPALVTMRPEEPQQLTAVRKPSRDMKEALLTPEQEENVISLAKEKLKEGYKLNSTKAPVPMLKKAQVYLNDEDEYVVKAKGVEDLWDNIRVSRINIPYIQPIETTILNGLMYEGEGMEVKAYDSLKKLMETTNRDDLRRSLMYLSGYRQSIEFNTISRDGGGTKQAVVVEDVGAYQYLLKLSVLFPAAIRRQKHSSIKFVVPIGPLLWKVRDIMVNFLSSKSNCHPEKWGEITDKTGRKPWEHQTTSLQEMKDQFEAGRKGHFLWIPVGMGKTLIVLSYLKYLLSKKGLPDYVIYGLPSSAIKSIISEVENFGFKVNLVVPIKAASSKHALASYIRNPGQSKIEPFMINLIEHDHMRRCEDTLLELAPKAVVIVDEVHKAFNETKRTAVALEITRLSEEFIALTGTPIIDSNTYKLIWWLEQIVPFAVNEKNFWVAANSMVAKKVSTGVMVDRVEVDATFNAEQKKAYMTLVPPGLGGKNSSPSQHDFAQAIEICYDSCTSKMVELTKEFIKENKGVMVVAKDVNHQNQLQEQIVKHCKLKKSEIFLINSQESIFLTDEAVNSKKVKDYKVVITTIRKCEGYTLTRLCAMVSSVYPSNNASREQIEGRINRIGQSAKEVHIRIVHTGLLTHILHRHNDAKNLSAALAALADDASSDLIDAMRMENM